MRRDIAGGVLVLVNAMIFIPAAIFFSTIKNESTVPASELLDQPAKIEERARAAEPEPPLKQFSRVRRTAMQKPVTTGSWQAATGTLWAYRGATMRLESVGRTRRFHFVDAGPGRNADVVFDGVREGPTFSGLAYLATGDCPLTEFHVKGSINADETAIFLRGKRPLYDGGCKVAGYSDEELDFTLLKKL